MSNKYCRKATTHKGMLLRILCIKFDHRVIDLLLYNMKTDKGRNKFRLILENWEWQSNFVKWSCKNYFIGMLLWFNVQCAHQTLFYNVPSYFVRSLTITCLGYLAYILSQNYCSHTVFQLSHIAASSDESMYYILGKPATM